MTPRERVLAALNHQAPDRVAVDLGGHRSSGIMAIAYARLKEALGIRSGDVYVYDMVQQLAVVEEPVLEALGIDVIEMGRAFHQDPGEWQDWELPDGTPCKIPDYLQVEPRDGQWVLLDRAGRELGVQKPGCLYFEQTHWPWLDVDPGTDSLAGLADVLGQTIWTGTPHPGAHLRLDAAGLAEMGRRAAALRRQTDRAIVGLFGGNLFELPQWLFRMDNYLMYLGLYPDEMRELATALCELHLANLEAWLGAVGPHIDVILFGDDLGSQTGPLLAPAMYRDIFKPCHARLWQRAKELADVKVMLHSCGAIEPLLDDLIEAGLDAVNPVQITCEGMDAAHLKARFGSRLTFWGGGCDTRRILPTGTPAEVRAHVREQVDVLGRDGGFVFQQVHNIMADVPPENVIAMYEGLGTRRG